jgi:AcrR family transcriptional regulator
VAKATFYRHFPSKDDLVVAWLQDPHTRWLDRVRREAEAHHAEPSEVIPLFFEVLADWLETEGYRGCPYLNTAVEIVDPAHPARAAIRDYLDESEAYDYSIDAAGEPDCGARGLPVRITLLDGR